MNILDQYGNEIQDRADLMESLTLKDIQLREAESTAAYFKESLAELELAIEDTGWQRIGDGMGSREFSRLALGKIMRLSRLMYFKNPLIKNGSLIQAHYVWGQGVQITAQNPDIQALLDAWIRDHQNASELTSHRMRKMREVELKVTGNIFFMLFVNDSTGWVRIASVYQDEITAIRCNPENANEPWWYCRTYQTINIDGSVEGTKKTWYPDWRYRYSDDFEVPSEISNDSDIDEDHPIYHIKVGYLPGMRFGVPETYAALDWARAVKDDLEDYATTKRALASFAWKHTVKGGKGAVLASKNKFQSTLGNMGGFAETNPPATRGATWIQSEGAGDMNPIRTAGMTPNPEDGQRLWLMVCAAMGIPETMLAGNADVGNFATSKTLDRPTELQMEDRREMWADVFNDLFNFLIDRVIDSANGKLKGSKRANVYTGEPEWVLAGSTPDGETGPLTDDTGDSTDTNGDRTIHINFPPILEHDILETVQAVQIAMSTGLLPPRVLARILASAFGETDVDEILAQLKDKIVTGDGSATGDGDSGTASDDPSQQINDMTLDSTAVTGG